MSTTRVITNFSYAWNNNLNDKLPKDETPELQEKVAEVARRELREEDSIKTTSLTQFREWIKQNRDLQNCRTDESFLLRFLRAKKYSLPMAQQTLLKYVNLRQTFPHVFFNLDYTLPTLEELLSCGFIFASPVRDQNGRRVLITLVEKFDPYKYTSSDMAKMHVMAYETLLEDEENQVMGFVHIGDCAHGSAAHITLWSPTEFATLLKWGEQSIPMRHKEVHILNLPSAVKYVFDFARTRLSQKMKNRITVHSNWDDVRNNVDPNILPKEYGGTIPMADMIDMWRRELSAKRERLLSLDNIKLLSDQGIICRKNSKHLINESDSNGIVGLSGSFRRLEVD